MMVRKIVQTINDKWVFIIIIIIISIDHLIKFQWIIKHIYKNYKMIQSLVPLLRCENSLTYDSTAMGVAMVCMMCTQSC